MFTSTAATDCECKYEKYADAKLDVLERQASFHFLSSMMKMAKQLTSTKMKMKTEVLRMFYQERVKMSPNNYQNALQYYRSLVTL